MILKAILRLVLYAVAILAIANFVPGIGITSFYAAVLVALLWSLMGLTLRPVLLVLTLPINFLTLGLFTFVLNALLFWLIALMAPGFSVDGFLPALQGSILLTLVGWVLHAVL